MANKPPKLTKEEQAVIDAHNAKMRAQHLEQDFKMNETRGRGLTVGTAFGGTTEVSMRRSDGSSTWVLLQPVEVVELIYQLAANVGCNIDLQPRNDFATWRTWNHTISELEHFRGTPAPIGAGHPPHVKAIKHGGYASQLPPAEEQPGMPLSLVKEEHEAVAIEAPKQRGTAKRAAAAS
jgi:hypothetical protein